MADDQAPKKTRNKSTVPSVEKALDVLELLAEAPEGLTMNEIVDRLGRTMGELYRVVVYLSERGYLNQDDHTNRYALTLRMFELSHRYDPTERLIRAAVPLMERYAALTEQSCHLGVLNRANVLILASVKSPRPAGYSVRIGAMFPVEQTSTGMVVLALSPEAVQTRFLRRLDEDARPAIATRMEQIRAEGFDDSESRLVDGVRNFSVPIHDSRGVVAALTTGFIAQADQKTRPDEALRILRDVAAELSHELGALD
ncbi:IclR family transcriptional regulator [Jannaschia sp. M317]|uniref:IclR family transcriptional regulator n=1 Tax=Jannaschia sp. M317 TaxID=2867011 RepID=UPI0021A882A4|nr:IclR family transcriptional regulator [Jannaschia sp. M317]UWQ19890.1 IclR family transcriptional regulator [Jannaschia sp. M317]